MIRCQSKQVRRSRGYRDATDRSHLDIFTCAPASGQGEGKPKLIADVALYSFADILPHGVICRRV
jgi:hypothetical protein